MNVHDGTTIDMSRALALLAEAAELCKEVDGRRTDTQDDNKRRMRMNAENSRLLLYAAHIADLGRAEIVSSYHRFKGENPPAIEV